MSEEKSCFNCARLFEADGKLCSRAYSIEESHCARWKSYGYPRTDEEGD